MVPEYLFTFHIEYLRIGKMKKISKKPQVKLQYNRNSIKFRRLEIFPPAAPIGAVSVYIH